jgi:putative transposase
MHKYDPQKHHRRSIRLKGFDYSSEGLYFITICVQDRICLFGAVENGQMILNAAGQMVEAEWLKLPERFPNIELHEFVVMPNHFHGILEIVGRGGGTATRAAPTAAAPTVGEMMGAFQSIVTVEYIRGVKNEGWPRFFQKLFQRDYWEHIIRNERAFTNISNYIKNNPAKWEEDRFYR